MLIHKLRDTFSEKFKLEQERSKLEKEYKDKVHDLEIASKDAIHKLEGEIQGYLSQIGTLQASVAKRDEELRNRDEGLRKRDEELRKRDEEAKSLVRPIRLCVCLANQCRLQSRASLEMSSISSKRK